MLADELDVRGGEAVEERRRRLVRLYRHLDLADDRARVGGRVDDLEQRHARLASPERIAHGIGARPRWRGKSVGCIPKTPPARAR